MTDLISAPTAGTDRTEVLSTSTNETTPPGDGGRRLEWAPMEPAPKKRRLGLWLGPGAGALLLAAGGASTLLIAPGTTVAGIPVGWMTPGMATEAISAHLARTEVVLTGTDATVSGADLGASLDASALAEQAFAERPMWNVTAWMGEPIDAEITLDPEAAEHTLRAALPGSYEAAVDATVVFDPAAGAYTTTASEPGTGIDLEKLTAAFADATAAGQTSFEFPGAPTEAPAAITDEEAAETAAQLNSMLASIGFYVGEERTVPIAPDVAASWLSVEAVDGELEITADETAIQAVVDTLPGLVNREPVNARNIVDSDGTVLKELTPGQDGRVLGDTSNAASEFAAQLSAGDAAYPLAVTSTPFETTALFRRIEVDLSEQRTYLFENEQLVQSWAISSGTAATPTDTGHFKVYAYVRIQDMRGTNADGSKYVTEDVPWVSYYNGDEAFHGTYWHDNFGTPMSHGCVNMTFDAAQYVYEWSTIGTEVWVHN
ncbi:MULTISPECIES: L,D-transpeptidase family protein [Microbacterium]|uniref:L,D-transpeptidase family protein n=1 Tax=Microbacterium TaxID=33882 RepID=UPI00217CFBF5|nr:MULTISPECIES: L,D-transpeptidase family protein [Microbacterium]UWF77963.1 L,D-transpeptidase family protein [Microbacterium neungamense]WCM56140.1 L,D-transpeptidase family protein [Microbacterium sp. EF45047]